MTNDPNFSFSAHSNLNGALPYVAESFVDVANTETTRTEIVQVIIAWLVQEGFTSSAQLLREEATARLRSDNYQQKNIHALCRSIEERNWELAHKNVKKLQKRVQPRGVFQVEYPSQLNHLVRLLPFAVTQQQYLEMVDEDDAQRAFSFFMRFIKPLEPFISRNHFQKLSYLLSCKTVSESASVYPEYRGWTPELGRTQLRQYIERTMGSVTMMPYFRQDHIPTYVGEPPLKPLELIIGQSLSFDVLRLQQPHLFKGSPRIMAQSIRNTIDDQLPPIDPMMQLDVSSMIKHYYPTLPAKSTVYPLSACQPFFSSSTMAVSAETKLGGAVLWVSLGLLQHYSEGQGGVSPMLPIGPALPPPRAAASFADHAGVFPSPPSGITLVYQHPYPIRGMRAHRASQLLVWGGCQAVVLNVERFNSGVNGIGADEIAVPSAMGRGASQESNQTRSAAESSLRHVCAHEAEVCSGCFFPCGNVVAIGLSNGSVALWDVESGSKMCESSFGCSPIIAILVSPSGTTYYAGSKDGPIRIVDVATGVMVNALVPPTLTELSAMTLSPSFRYLLAFYRGGDLRLWDVFSCRLFPLSFSGVECASRTSLPIAFANNDAFLYSGTEGGCLLMWNLTANGETEGREWWYETPTPHTHAAIGTAPTDASWQCDPYSYPLRCPPRWPKSQVKRPFKQFPLHQACLTDVKTEGPYLVCSSDDGKVSILSNFTRANILQVHL